MKSGLRVLGVDDSPFDRGNVGVFVVGVVCRKEQKAADPDSQSLITEAVLSTSVTRDGDDATEKLCQMILASRFKSQLHAILLNSIMLAGFNVVDLQELSKRTGLPVIAITRKKPDMKAAKRAVRNTGNWEQKLLRMNSASIKEKIGPWHAQLSGIDLNGARHILRIFGNGPTRLAHVIASGVVRGESHGRS